MVSDSQLSPLPTLIVAKTEFGVSEQANRFRPLIVLAAFRDIGSLAGTVLRQTRQFWRNQSSRLCGMHLQIRGMENCCPLSSPSPCRRVTAKILCFSARSF